MEDGYLRPMNRIKFIQLALPLLFVVALQNVWAQATLLDPINVIEGTLSDPEFDEIAFHWDVANFTSDTLVLWVSRDLDQNVEPYNCPYVEEGEGAYDRFCWGPLCYPYCSVNSNLQDNFLVTISPGDTNSTFYADYYHSGVPGVTALRYSFRVLSNPDATVQHTVLVCLDAENCAVGTNEISVEMDLGQIAPQPIRGISALSYRLGEGQSGIVQIYNAVGQVMKSRQVNQSQGILYINGDEFAEGAYILRVESSTGESKSHHFIVQH